MKIEKLLEAIKRKKIEYFDLDDYEARRDERMDKQDLHDFRPNQSEPLDEPSGSYGYVKDHEYGHDVVKQPHVPIQRKELKLDGYHAFIKIALKHQDNPCFPKIREVRITHDETHILPEYDIEKLIKYTDVPKEVLESTINRYMDVSSPKNWHHEVPAMSVLSRAVETGDLSDIKDKHLKDACHILNKNKEDYHLDIHFNNIMFRFSGGAYQLVFIDPFANKADAEVEWD